MAVPILYTNEVYDFSQLPNPLDVGMQPHSGLDKYNSHHHPEVGMLTYSNIAYPHLHISDMHWETEDAIQLHNTIPNDAIFFNFHTHGDIRTHYNALKRDLRMGGGKHYLVYTPEGGFFNEVKSEENIGVFHLSLDKSFFAATIGNGDAWSDQLLVRLNSKDPFMGSGDALDITPPMWQLIQRMKTCQANDPVSNMLMQSLAFELIALQLEQSRGADSQQLSSLKPDERQKLERLKDYLDVHFLSELSLAKLSREVLLNEFKLKRGFRMLFGTSVFGYLRTRRMDHAARLLQQGMSIADVADELGYEHPHHFSTAFKSYMGVSPSVFGSQYSREL